MPRQNTHCPKCRILKTKDNTRIKLRNKNGLDAYCFKCDKEYKIKDYAKNAVKYRANARKNRREYLRKGRETGQGKYAPENIKAVNAIHSFRRFDRDRGLQNDMTFEFIFESHKKPCFYCGSTDLNMTLDRIDNSKGHIVSNVNPACVRCNYFRKDMPYLAWLKIVPSMKEALDEGLFGDWIPGPKSYKIRKNE